MNSPPIHGNKVAAVLKMRRFGFSPQVIADDLGVRVRDVKRLLGELPKLDPEISCLGCESEHSTRIVTVRIRAVDGEDHRYRCLCRVCGRAGELSNTRDLAFETWLEQNQ